MNLTKKEIKSLINHGIDLNVTPELIREQCSHWATKGDDKKLHPTVRRRDQWNWECTFCGAIFPIRPVGTEAWEQAYDNILAQINQVQFYGVSLSEDLSNEKELFVALKKLLPQYLEICRDVYKTVELREEFSSSDISDLPGFNAADRNESESGPNLIEVPAACEHGQGRGALMLCTLTAEHSSCFPCHTIRNCTFKSDGKVKNLK